MNISTVSRMTRVLGCILLLALTPAAWAVDFTLNAPGTTNNPWTPANVIIPVSTLQSEASPNRFRAGSGAYTVFAHNATYGSTITATFTINSNAAIHVADDLYLGAVVRTGGNAGAIIGVYLSTGGVGTVTVSPSGVRTPISTGATWPTTPAAGDVISATITISGGTATITGSQNGTAFTFSANTTTTYTGEASLAAGGSFDPQNNNTTGLSQFTGTGVAAGGIVVNPISGRGGAAARPLVN